MRDRLRTKGRRETGRFVAVPKVVLESEEYAALTAHEVKLLLDLFAQFNGRNNGDFQCVWKLMQQRGWRSPDTLNRALHGLRDCRFVILTRQGGKHKCSLYAVTWLPINECSGKIDVAPTRTAPGIWKKSVLREAVQCTTAGEAIHAS